ncbi:MAG: molybdopterin-dependent oxidoreductase [Chloroflexi bacterium]|nr:molybdopterin-dependent oxidoreductase [Chloroflexota bacterium]
MPDDITISIDGVEIKTQPGKMVLEAAIDAGIYVPYLCYHPGMKPFAACRMCVVSVEGGRGYPAACTLPVADGMRVSSESQDVNELRRSVMQMLIAEHPNGCLTCHRIDICGPTDVCLRHVSVNDRCVTCPKNERCEFKDTVRYLGMELESPLNYKYKQIPLEVADPFYDRDYNLCIACGRCVRACEEVRVDDAICFTERSGKALVGTSFGTSLLESGCEFCGACIDVCPVGALVERDHKWEKPRKIESTICPHCPVGCQLNLELNGSGEPIRVVPEFNAPANRGQACFKGKFGMEFISRKDRVERPLIRRDGELAEATWDEALDYVATRLTDYKGKSFALLASPDGTNEELYLAQKFARVAMTSNNVDITSNLQPEQTLALERGMGYGAATNSIWDLEQSNCILTFNTNVTEDNNVLALPIKRAVREGASLVVIDVREVELTRHASLWLRPAPGTELLLLGGILREILDQGLDMKDWVDGYCEDPATLVYYLNNLDLDEIAAATQVSRDSMAEAASLFGEAEKSAVCFALDNISRELQRDCASALVDLALLTGNVGKPGSGLYPVRLGANEQGAWDVGCIANRLPGRGAARNERARSELEEILQCSLPTDRGLELADCLEGAADGRIKSMFLIGDSPNFTNGRLENGLAALDNLDFLVVMDTFLTQAGQRADVVLPRASLAEKTGSITNLERRIQGVKPAFRPAKGEPESELWVLGQLGQRLSATGFNHASADEVMEEISRVVPAYAGVSHAILESASSLVFTSGLDSPKPTQMLYAGRTSRGIQWPVSEDQRKGTATLYSQGFPLGRANLVAPEFRVAESSQETDYPAWLAPGRVLLQRDRDNRIEMDPGSKRNAIVREEVIELNSSEGAKWSVAEGDLVRVEFAQSEIAGVVRFNPTVPTGVIGVTGLFGQLAVELESSDEPNPMAGAPGLNVVPARIVKALGTG